MKIYNKLFEVASDVVYHVSRTPKEILKNNFFIASLAGPIEPTHNKSYFYYMSTARSIQSSYISRAINDCEIIFELDGRKLSVNNKAHPIDALIDAFSGNGSDEQEDRVILSGPILKNFNKYIKRVLFLSSLHPKTISELKKYNQLDIFVEEDFKEFLTYLNICRQNNIKIDVLFLNSKMNYSLVNYMKGEDYYSMLEEVYKSKGIDIDAVKTHFKELEAGASTTGDTSIKEDYFSLLNLLHNGWVNNLDLFATRRDREYPDIEFLFPESLLLPYTHHNSGIMRLINLWTIEYMKKYYGLRDLKGDNFVSIFRNNFFWKTKDTIGKEKFLRKENIDIQKLLKETEISAPLKKKLYKDLGLPLD